MSRVTPGAVTVLPVEGIGEIRAGADLASVIARAGELRADDIVVVTSKIVSKAEGRAVRAGKAELLGAETRRIVARRDPVVIVRNRLGLVMAGAGIDSSNTEPGTSLLLPADPDASARDIRAGLRGLTGLRLGVVVSDTSGRAWRRGQTDIAIGAAGVTASDSHVGRVDPYGNRLAVTEPAVADELAAAADLVKGKLSRCPVAVVRGLGHLVSDEDGPGATALIRDEGEDLFGLGARQAVLVAAGLETAPPVAFGSPEPAGTLCALLSALSTAQVAVTATAAPEHVTVWVESSSLRHAGRASALVEVVASGCGWLTEWDDGSPETATARLTPAAAPDPA